MKKTMFITSVIMVVVMAIALTTSSLAWFTASSNAYVTTNALSISAAAQTTTGIKVGDAATGPFYATVSLSSSAVSGMMPLFPLSGQGTPAASDLLAALAYETGETPVAAPKFIANTVTGTGSSYQFDGASTTSTGYFVKDIWITNVSTTSGAAGGNYMIKPSITYTTTSDGTYNWTTSDPVLYVAVLAKGTNASDDAWEIVDIFNSTSTSTVEANRDVTIKVGKTEEAFQQTADPLGCYGTLNLSALAARTGTANAGNTTKALPAPTSGAYEGVPQQFRIVAWYAGDTLKNLNSNFGVKYTLRFDATAYAAIS